MSENLQRFLAEWLEWVEDGAPKKGMLRRYQGLCSNFSRWLHARSADWDEIDREIDQFKNLFAEDGLDEEYPFGGCSKYCAEAEKETMHKNPERLAWVRSKVEQFATANAK